MNNDTIRKLDDVIKAVPEEFKDAHPLSPHWYVSELCRYLQREIRTGKLGDRECNMILDMPIIDIKQALNYRGLSFFDNLN
ncbi:MAG: hypothetical protein AABX83_00590 [Nanoarchaeota archaeon]